MLQLKFVNYEAWHVYELELIRWKSHSQAIPNLVMNFSTFALCPSLFKCLTLTKDCKSFPCSYFTQVFPISKKGKSREVFCLSHSILNIVCILVYILCLIINFQNTSLSLNILIIITNEVHLALACIRCDNLCFLFVTLSQICLLQQTEMVDSKSLGQLMNYQGLSEILVESLLKKQLSNKFLNRHISVVLKGICKPLETQCWFQIKPHLLKVKNKCYASKNVSIQTINLAIRVMPLIKQFLNKTTICSLKLNNVNI